MKFPKISWETVMAVLVALVIAYAFKKYVWNAFMASDEESANSGSGFTGNRFSRAA